jgi:DHA2 family multidrug resistance protein
MAAPPRPSAMIPQRPDPPEPTPAIWLCFSAMIFGNFMSLLDVQIVASAIGDIQAGVGASRDEISWVQTAYLIAEVIAIPLSGFLGRALGMRVLFSCAAMGFAAMSVACALSWDLNSLIVFRAMQGFIGGALVPTTMTMAFLSFPQRHQATSSTMIGLVSTLGPTLGPTLGGWIAETYDWRWLFWVNVIPGVTIALIVWNNLKMPGPNWKMLKGIDFFGLIGLAAMLGAAQYVLEQGPKDGWTDSKIIAFALVSLSGAIVFFVRALARTTPIVDLRPFANPSFTIATMLGFILGAALFGPVFLQPLFLSTVRGYNPLQIGHSMFAQGLTMMAMAPFTARLSQRVSDPRPIAAAAFGLIAVSCWLQSQLTAESGLEQFWFPQILRGMGMMVAFVTVMRPAFATLSAELVQSATGLYNLVRNLGGAFGIALLLTVQAHSYALHKQELYAAADPARPQAATMLAGISQTLAQAGWRGDGDTAALGQYVFYLDREALVMTFNDQFQFLMAALIAAMFGVFLMRRPQPIAPAPALARLALAVRAGDASAPDPMS